MNDAYLTAAEAVAATVEYGSVKAHAGLVFWVAYDPHTGCNRLHCLDILHQSMTCLTPDWMSVRSRVHEYGGGAWSIAGKTDQGRSEATSRFVAWVNDQDQQIWLTALPASTASTQPGSIDPGALNPEALNQPKPSLSSYRLSSQPDMRFADLTYDAVRHRLLAVAEIHTEEDKEPRNLLVAICLNSGTLSELASGADFYAAPTLSPDGRWLAWLEWNHPQQPWLNTSVWMCDLEQPDQAAIEMTSPHEQVAWLQPRFSPSGELLAVGDVDNWWNLFRLSTGATPMTLSKTPLSEIERAEFTQAPWQLGQCSYGWNTQGELLAIAQAEGYSTLRRYQADHQRWHLLPLPFSRLHSLALAGDHAFMVAECAERSAGIIQLNLRNSHWRYLCGGEPPGYTVSLPRTLGCPLDSGDTLPFFYYSPQKSPPQKSPPQKTHLKTHLMPATDGVPPLIPPLIMLIHGGPTSSTAPVLNPRIQYWTQHGFAVADLNYRGSCGYGRDYRLMLQGRWGIADAEDAESVADWLVSQGLADARALFIRGQSAGGYTVLMALLRSQRWCAGASLYGISDLQRLAQTTHKFESRYLNWLIGDPDDQVLFRQRSPYYLADGWKTPVIFFQGGKDRVVPPEQTLRLQERLQQAGVRVAACIFEEEGHGFRLASNQQQVLEQEMAFYIASLEVEKG